MTGSIDRRRVPQAGRRGRRRVRVGPRSAHARARARQATTTSISSSSRTRTGASRARPIPTPRGRSEGGRRRQRACRAAGFHHVHRRPHAHDRRPEGAPAAPGANSATSSSDLKVKDVRFMPGEHDASLDRGKAFKEFFGETHYTFDHKGVHFIVLDNVSDPAAQIGDEQLAWLAADLAQPAEGRAHRRLHAPAALRPLSAVGLGDARRREGGRPAAAVSERDRVLRPHPPGAPPHDRAHRAPLGEVADVSAARGRARSRSARRCRGIRRSPTTGSVSASVEAELAKRELRAHRASGAEGMSAMTDRPTAPPVHRRASSLAGRGRPRRCARGAAGRAGRQGRRASGSTSRRARSTLTKGVPAVLEFTTRRRADGLQRCRISSVRADILPGKVAARALRARQGGHVRLRLRHLLRLGPRGHGRERSS